MEREVYMNKAKELVKNFDKDFFDKYYNYDATFRAVFEMLIRDANPYELIKRLIEDRKTLVDKINELVELMPPNSIIKI